MRKLINLLRELTESVPDNETETKDDIRDVLDELGWTRRQVRREWTRLGRPVDLALLDNNGDCRVLIEAKKPDVPLMNGFDQLRDYSRALVEQTRTPATISMLTNGREYILYSPNRKGEITQPFAQIKIGDDNAADEIKRFLLADNVFTNQVDAEIRKEFEKNELSCESQRSDLRIRPRRTSEILEDAVERR